MTLTIRDLTPADAAACDAVIASLPYFFGDPQGVEDCARAVRTQEGVVATSDGAPIGFLTIERHTPESAEITWMAVQASHRHAGVGRALIDAACERLRHDGVRMLCVLTLGSSVPEDVDDSYEGTRRFYRAMGFVPLRELELRGWNDAYALMLVRALA